MQKWMRDVLRPLRPKSYATRFNAPIKFSRGEWFVNERIVEVAYAVAQIPRERCRVMDFGCTKSDLVLQLASAGHDVTGIDLRPYGFDHPNLTLYTGDVLDFDGGPFDVITSLSVLEHVGLGAYGEPADETKLVGVLSKLRTLLVPGGRLLVTVPVGRPYVDEFLRSFTPDEFTQMCVRSGLDVKDARYFRRANLRHWLPCDAEVVADVSNLPSDRGKTGVNGVGCFTLTAA